MDRSRHSACNKEGRMCRKEDEEAGPSKRHEEEHWNCRACTSKNKAFDVLCDMCATPRYSDQWACTKCSFRNPRTETECTACRPSTGNTQAVTRAGTRKRKAVTETPDPDSEEDVYE